MKAVIAHGYEAQQLIGIVGVRTSSLLKALGLFAERRLLALSENDMCCL